MAQVALVPHQHDDDVVVSVVPQLLQPALHILIRQVLGDVVHQESPDGAAVIAGDGINQVNTKRSSLTVSTRLSLQFGETHAEVMAL